MKTTNFILEEAVSICAYLMCGIDGDIGDSELQLIHDNKFFSQYNPGDHLDLFLELLRSDDEITSIMSSEFPKVFENCDSVWKKDYINSQVKLLLADGEIEESEQNVLNFTAGLMGLSGEDVLEIIQEDNQRMREQVQSAKKQPSKKEGCFVATAVMGDYNDPLVLDLRKYRDETIQKSAIGRGFINLYYRFGPIPAKVIAKNDFLRLVVLKALIKPLHKLVKRTIKPNSF
jgi:uncharacterized tellurite resistance protein B-like protein|tara:strand:- start:235 stop:927 length:693 start_codon:yes stop_codon:yes gene_type:complete